MTLFAVTAFLAASAAWASAILAFPRARPRVGGLLIAGLAVSAIAIGLGLISGLNPAAFWAGLFGAAALGCGFTGRQHFHGHPERWVHRFTIYVGYAAVFDAMAALALAPLGLAGWAWAGALVVAWVAGSAAIFRAKNATLRAVQAEMPDYFKQWGQPGGW
ncbi:MAG: hypothetical protein ABUS57_04640 [Pseudomonadota bacterium]